MNLSANQAAKEANIAKKTLLEALKTGRLSATKDDKGHWQIAPAELFRVFPKTADHQSPEPKPTPSTETENRIEIARLQAALEGTEAQLGDMRETVADLRARLDEERTDRRAAQARLEDMRDKLAERPAAPAPQPVADPAPVFRSRQEAQEPAPELSQPAASGRGSWLTRAAWRLTGGKLNT